MDNLISNFTSMEGRIGRQSWWIGSIILVVVFIVLGMILGLVFGASMIASFSTNAGNDPAALQAMVGNVQRAAWVGLVLWLLISYPSIALGVKRRHDRDNNGMDVIGYFVLSVVISLLQGIGLTNNVLGTILGVISLVYAIYLLVVLGFLKGTSGPNQYGADPLGGGA